MIIEDLPEKYKDLALLRMEQYEGKFYYKRDDEKTPLPFAFNWSETPEGVEFWKDVNAGELPPFEEIDKRKYKKSQLFKN